MDVTKESYHFFIETMRRNGSKPLEVHQLLHDAWKEKAPSQTTVFRLYKEFSTGSRDSFEDSERSGRPHTACTPENVDAVDQLIQENSRITLREIEKELDISRGTIHTIVSVHLQLTSLCSRWIPHALTAEQRQKTCHFGSELASDIWTL